MPKRSRAEDGSAIPPVPDESDGLWMLERDIWIKEQLKEWLTKFGLPISYAGPALINLVVKMAEPGAWEKYNRRHEVINKGRPKKYPNIDLVVDFETYQAKRKQPKRLPTRTVAGLVLQRRRLDPTKQRKDALAKVYKRDFKDLMKLIEASGHDRKLLDKWVADEIANPTKSRTS